MPVLHMLRRCGEFGGAIGGAPFQGYQMVHRFDTLLIVDQHDFLIFLLIKTVF